MDGKGFFSVPSPRAAPCGRLDAQPLVNFVAKDRPELVAFLAEDYALDSRDAFRKPLHRVDERAGVRKWGICQGMEA